MAVLVVTVVLVAPVLLVARPVVPVALRVLTLPVVMVARVVAPVPAVTAVMVSRARRAWRRVQRVRPAVTVVTPGPVVSAAPGVRPVPAAARLSRVPPATVVPAVWPVTVVSAGPAAPGRPALTAQRGLRPIW